MNHQLTIVANTVAKYVLHGIDLYSENPWENKAVFMLYTELAIGFVKVIKVITSSRQLASYKTKFSPRWFCTSYSSAS